MAIKINNLIIKGIRGAKDTLELPLNGKSILLYGDNGTGKSSISDAIEWFYTNKIKHLSTPEIDTSDAIRNAKLLDVENSEVSISYTNSSLDATKTLSLKNNKLVQKGSNTSEDFKKYIDDSEKENLISRYQYIRNFVDSTKGEKLKYLSDIIGFEEVTKIKGVLLKSLNNAKSTLKTQNFETLINNEKQKLILNIGASITQEKNLFETINDKIKKLNTGIEVKSIEDIKNLLILLSKGVDANQQFELKFLEDSKSALMLLKNEIKLLDDEYSKYFNEFETIANDVEAIKQTFFEELLKAGTKILSSKYLKDDNCPLCLQLKNSDELLSEIKIRLANIEESSQKKAKFGIALNSVKGIAIERIKRLDVLLNNTQADKENNQTIKDGLTAIKTKIQNYQNTADIKVTSGDKLPVSDIIKLVENDFEFLKIINDRIIKIQESQKGETATVLYSKITASRDAFFNIKKFESQKVILENQQISFDLIYNEFEKQQKDGLDNFINSFSVKINEYYQFMNPDEPFQNIEIITKGEEDELDGLTIKYKYNDKWEINPLKHFSESHLNCLGLSFFLASVDAFNTENDFLILDDVISSFDSNHRRRFADLLFDKFSKHQIILLTHEKEWFTNIISPKAKNKGWLVNEIKWTEAKGTHLKEKPSDLKESILHQLSEGNIDNIGNPIRKYLEHCLKDIALNFEAKLSFRYNDSNEHRMPYELLMAIRSEIKKSSAELKLQYPLLDRIESSALFGNALSHDNPINASIGDINSFWADILELEKLFICQEAVCKRPKVSLLNYDNVTNKIRCSCDATKYDWKK
ncbi:AAA family ATPase [Flavobacterium sp. XN-5]|uniref:AAA family ATPase n=1 Tax=Flavobacterium sp. XN-5 TaxID=2599390 RepID=UPI0011CAEADF|nr:AAA family ATPase [Flavobacterium sp. XN-5]NGY37252.1 AAA family ATPase [Flavobacterium sp. XN-5]